MSFEKMPIIYREGNRPYVRNGILITAKDFFAKKSPIVFKEVYKNDQKGSLITIKNFFNFMTRDVPKPVYYTVNTQKLDTKSWRKVKYQ